MSELRVQVDKSCFRDDWDVYRNGCEFLMYRSIKIMKDDLKHGHIDVPFEPKMVRHNDFYLDDQDVVYKYIPTPKEWRIYLSNQVKVQLNDIIAVYPMRNIRMLGAPQNNDKASPPTDMLISIMNGKKNRGEDPLAFGEAHEKMWPKYVNRWYMEPNSYFTPFLLVDGRAYGLIMPQKIAANFETFAKNSEDKEWHEWKAPAKKEKIHFCAWLIRQENGPHYKLVYVKGESDKPDPSAIRTKLRDILEEVYV